MGSTASDTDDGGREESKAVNGRPAIANKRADDDWSLDDKVMGARFLEGVEIS